MLKLSKLKGDTLDILTQFTRPISPACHLLLQNARLLNSHFSKIHIQHTLKEDNMCADFATNEKIKLDDNTV